MDTVEFVATTSQLEDYKVVDIYIFEINYKMAICGLMKYWERLCLTAVNMMKL